MRSSTKASVMARSNPASIAQDRAAGGAERRLLRTKSGDVVTVSVVLTGAAPTQKASLRFRLGGAMVSRPIGVIETSATEKALVLAWAKLRGDDDLVESNGWAWINR